MVFAEIITRRSYYEFYHELLSYILTKYQNVESGIQGDAWIWVIEADEKVAIDTFSSMYFQIKSPRSNGVLVGSLINFIKDKYPVFIYDPPEIEPHE